MTGAANVWRRRSREMANDLPLYQRRRDPTPGELSGIPWLQVLAPHERDRAARELTVGDALPDTGIGFRGASADMAQVEGM